MSWFENIAGCMLAAGLALRMLPDRKYEQYVRLFTGFLLLIIFLQPLLRIGSADDLLEHKMKEFAEEQELMEAQIFEESTEFFEEHGTETGQENGHVREIVIEPVLVEVTGDD